MLKTIKEYKKYILIFAIPVLLIYYSTAVIYTWDYKCSTIGGVSPADDLVEIVGHKDQTPFYYTYYTQRYDLTLLEYLLAKADPKVILEEPSETEVKQMVVKSIANYRFYNTLSTKTALIVAYQKLHLPIEYEFEPTITATYDDYITEPSFPLAGIIRKVNQIEVHSTDDINNIVNDIECDVDTVFTVETDGTLVDYTLQKTEKNGIRSYGFDKMDRINILSASKSYDIKETNANGESAGLMQALNIYNELTEEDLTQGKKVTGTGAIDLDGTIRKIGGAKQKVYAAYKYKADIFFVPAENYEEALEAYEELHLPESLQIVKVTTFDEALQFLQSR